MPEPASLDAPNPTRLRLVGGLVGPPPAATAPPEAAGVRAPQPAADLAGRVRPARPRRDAAARPVRVLRFPGVYVPEGDTRLLAAALLEEDLRDARVLELCTGSGVLAATAARAGAHVTAVDLSRRAALSARANLRLNGLRGRVLRGDLLAAVPAGSFDVVVANPPYVPAAEDVPGLRGRARHWSAGHAGRAVIDRICEEAPGRLAPGGVLLLVHSEVSDLDATVARLRGAGLEAAVTRERHLPFGPVMRRQAALLRSSGAIGSAQRHERIAVVRATAPRAGAA